MCGLVAWLNPIDGLNINLLEAMTHKLEHRGPDDFGFAAIGNGTYHAWRERPPQHGTPMARFGLGHRRLSILDTSDAGRQPMSSPDGRYWIVYNGEVYNFAELRDELRSLGFRFLTGTDTEVILRAFEVWGSKCFERFNGMWALVIVDSLSGTVTACRDRFGVKPLYYWNRGSEWLFSSEVKALSLNPSIQIAPDEFRLQRFLCSVPSIDQSETFFSGIRSVKPGTILTIREGRSKEDTYWSASTFDSPASGQSDATCFEELRNLLEDSVRIRLRSDVRVGTMVSGGIDSTSVISIIRDLMLADPRAREAVGNKLHGFHAHFPGHPIDEQKNVTALSQAHELNIYSIEPMQLKDVATRYISVVNSMERPFVRSVPLVNTLLMECAKVNGISVVLNGHGADEIFAGYPAYVVHAGADLLSHGRFLDALLNAKGSGRSGMSVRLVVEAMLRTAFPSIFSRIFPPPTNDVTRGGVLRKLDTARWEVEPNERRGSHLHSRLRADFTQNILPDWLHMEDRTSMSASVEAREPFLDYRLVEFGFRLGNEMKIRNGMTKYALRQAMSRHLPGKIAQDPRKQGFSGPDAVWLRGGMSDLIDEYLMVGAPRVEPFVDVRLMHQHIREFRKQTSDPVGPVLWKILESEIWLREFFA